MRRWVCFSVGCFILLAFVIPSSFAQTNSAPPKPQEVQSPGYPVMFGDQILFYVRDVKGYPAEVRARTVAERAKKVAEDPGIPVTSVGTSPYQQPITLVTAGDELLMAVFDEDASAGGRTRQEVATEYSQKLRTAIEKYRRDYSLRATLFGCLYLLIATLLFIGALYLLFKLHRTLDAAIQRLNSKKVSIHIQSFELVPAERIGATLAFAAKVIRFVILLVLIYAYVHAGLSFFPRTRPFAGQLLNYVLVPLTTIGGRCLGPDP